MLIKTSELSELTLCYAVCKIEMPYLVWGETIGIQYAGKQIVVPEMPSPKCYSPYMGWDMFGPIIERELLDITPYPNETEECLRWSCDQHAHGALCRQYGQTPLIAAMRCYVASKLGDTIEIPDELLDLK